MITYDYNGQFIYKGVALFTFFVIENLKLSQIQKRHPLRDAFYMIGPELFQFYGCASFF